MMKMMMGVVVLRKEEREREREREKLLAAMTKRPTRTKGHRECRQHTESVERSL
jgi:hypothetical protein